MANFLYIPLFFTAICGVLFAEKFWYLLPVLLLVLCLITLTVLYYHLFTHTRNGRFENLNTEYWRPAYDQLCLLWKTIGRIWHGYEVIGIENLPKEGPALLVFYHGGVPVDIWYMAAEIYLQMGRALRSVGDRFVFKIPGLKTLAAVFKIIPGPIDRCVHQLCQGNLLAVAPGGIRESQFSDENYSLLWGKRVGFARVALAAKVPIIPIFTENHREAFRSPWICRKLLRTLYEAIRWPVVPLYGGIPVKMITHIGKPIPYDSSLTPTELAQKTRTAMENLIQKHQTLPGSILRGLQMRFTTKAVQNEE